MKYLGYLKCRKDRPGTGVEIVLFWWAWSEWQAKLVMKSTPWAPAKAESKRGTKKGTNRKCRPPSSQPTSLVWAIPGDPSSDFVRSTGGWCVCNDERGATLKRYEHVVCCVMMNGV